MTVLDAAKALVKRGVSVVPVKATDKRPTCKWEPFQITAPALCDLEVLFRNVTAVGMICGKVSGNLECIDFDDVGAYPQWRQLLIDNGHEALVSSLVVQETKNGGRHAVYRCTEEVQGNIKLAEREEPKEVIVETRGEGGYFVACPSPGYKMEQGTWSKIPVISGEDRDTLLAAARMLGESVNRPYTHNGPEGVKRPGDVYAERNTWHDVLEPHGWQFSHERGGESFWVRPGKAKRDGLSATTNYRGADLLKVFSSNAHPFEPGATYTKFAAHAFLEHGGDMKAAAKAIAKAERLPKAKPSWNLIDSGRVADLKPPKTRRKSLADFEPEAAKFLLDDWRYLRDEQVNLLDAKGGSGKTTLIMGVAAMMSNGLSPGGAKIEPMKTLYYGSEDSCGEMRTVFDRLGGDPSMFIPVDDGLTFDDEGLETLHDDLEDTRAKLFILDAAKYYLPGGKGSEFDGPIVARFCGAMRKAAREHHATCLLVRHFTRNTKDRDLLDQGAGLAQWYDSCRSNLVMLKHPDKPGNSMVFHAKGSILSETLEPFGCGYANGQWGFWKPTDADYIAFGMEPGAGKQTKPGAAANGKQVDRCVAWLREFLSDAPQASDDVHAAAKAAGFSRDTTFKAKDRLGIKPSKDRFGGAGGWSWSLPEAETGGWWNSND